ncbi:hypothetical protein, conserved [Babesia bigemina]|uniref:Uncharacterized protein n=1 Tax=Babesia bigemina TaxID=5866 RepID=A0A061D4W1_BABBI|nr:hypothetical protein, conserved [Babesia bigemina]CDR93994.1 hypothetical protein, conserved [Babesia bigemina]|eukprot:XP_012766180.1 hypothetical protein, conserved [Babesia bigemina]
MVASRAFASVADAAARPVWKLKQTYYHRLWRALSNHKWSEFERLMREMRLKRLSLDEVTYTLKAHHCILNPHKPSLSCYLVLEEMKQALIHPAVIRMNEHLINSYFELEEIKCQPPSQLWQNFAKATWQTSFRLNRHRMKKLREDLERMDPEALLKLDGQAVATLAQDEFLQAVFSPTLAIDEIHDEPIAAHAATQGAIGAPPAGEMDDDDSVLDGTADSMLGEGAAEQYFADALQHGNHEGDVDNDCDIESEISQQSDSGSSPRQLH